MLHVLQIIKNHIVPSVKLTSAQLQAQTSPLPTLLGQSLQASPRVACLLVIV